MTTFEHAMLGVNGALALGLHQRHQWKIVAMAGVAAASPDWDGLVIVYSRAAFAEGHRLWGHNIFACFLIGILIGGLDYRCDLVTRCGRGLSKLVRIRDETQLEIRRSFAPSTLMLWIIVAIVAALTQLPADMVVSGTATLADWELRPFWPVSDAGWVFPLVPWGDVGVTLVFVAGMFAMLRWRTRVRMIATLTLAGVVAYLAIRGLM